MSSQVWLLSWLIVDSVLYSTIRSTRSKSDILRIIFNDIPTLHVFGIEALFQLLIYNSLQLWKGPIMFLALSWNTIYRQVLIMLGNLETSYDYFSLFKRFSEKCDILYSSARMVLIVCLFSLLRMVPNEYFNKYTTYIITLILYAYALTTFEDL